MDHKVGDCRPNDYNDQEAFALYLQWGLLQRSLGALFQCIENFLTMNKLVSHDGWIFLGSFMEFSLITLIPECSLTVTMFCVVCKWELP